VPGTHNTTSPWQALSTSTWCWLAISVRWDFTSQMVKLRLDPCQSEIPIPVRLTQSLVLIMKNFFWSLQWAPLFFLYTLVRFTLCLVLKQIWRKLRWLVHWACPRELLLGGKVCPLSPHGDAMEHTLYSQVIVLLLAWVMAAYVQPSPCILSGSMEDCWVGWADWQNASWADVSWPESPQWQ
jgi:hypothetical protein